MTVAQGSRTDATRTGRTTVGRALWTVAGLVAIALAVGWVVWWSPHPLLAAGSVGVVTNCWLSPPAYGAALLAWGCFRQAGPRDGRRSHHSRDGRPGRSHDAADGLSGRSAP